MKKKTVINKEKVTFNATVYICFHLILILINNILYINKIIIYRMLYECKG